jgi:hypothetical protein
VQALLEERYWIKGRECFKGTNIKNESKSLSDNYSTISLQSLFGEECFVTRISSALYYKI